MKSFIISQVLELDDPPNTIGSNSKEDNMRLDIAEKSGRYTATADAKEMIENIKEVHAQADSSNRNKNESYKIGEDHFMNYLAFQAGLVELESLIPS